MIKENVKYPEFSDVDFIRLFCAINCQNGMPPIIKHHELEKKLYECYYLPEFKKIFQDICPKRDYINPENSYLDLGFALNTAQLLGLLTPIYGSGEIKSIVMCDNDIAQEIIANFDIEIIDEMNNLFNIMKDIQGPKLVKSNSRH